MKKKHSKTDSMQGVLAVAPIYVKNQLNCEIKLITFGSEILMTKKENK